MKRLLVFPLAFLLLGSVGASELAWQSVRTEHFTFVYRPAHQRAIDELVTFADEVYDEIVGFIGSSPERIDVVLLGASDLANGYYSPAPPQHIGLYVAQPSLPWIGARTGSWLRLLFVHELTHYVQANADGGIFSLLGSVFGRTIAGLSLGFAPLWTTEGVAVNAETIFTEGGRGRDPFFEMEYKAPVVEDRLWSLNQSGYDSHLAPAGRYYVAGYFIWDHLIDEYGEEVAKEVLERHARFPFFGIRGPIRRATGVSARAVYSAATANLIRRYSDAADMEADELVSPRTRSDYYLPAVTDRGLYAYRRRPDRRPAIVEFDPVSGREQPIVEMRLSDEASWSATDDGRLIAFATVEADSTFPDEQAVISDLYLFDRDTGTTHRITTGGGYYQPAIAGDGTFLVAVRRSEGYHRLVRLELDGEEASPPRTLVETDRTRFYAPAVSPDGGRVAVTANQQGRQQLMIVDAATGAYDFPPQLAGGTPYFPTFADDETVYFSNDRGGELAVYRLSLRTGAVELVARDPVGAYAAREIDDGLLVATYTSDGRALRYRDTAAAAGSTGGATADSPARAESLPTIAAVAPAELPDPPRRPGSPYPVVAAPRFWLPALGLTGPGLDVSGLGGGAMLYGSDLFARNTWQVRGVYFPAHAQLDYALAWSTRYADWGGSLVARSLYRVLEDDEELPVHVQVFEHGGTLVYRPVSRYRLGASENLVFRVGAFQSVAFGSAAPFSLLGAGTAPVETVVDRITVGSDVAYSRSPLSSRRAFMVPGASTAALSVALPLDAPGYLPAGLVASIGGRANAGIAGSDHVVSLRPSLNYATDVELAAPLNLRGFDARTDHDLSEGLRGAYRVGLEYHAPGILVDLPLAPNVGITGFGLAAFAELTGGYDPRPASFVLDRDIALGGELTTVITFLQPFPVTVGVAARVDRTDPGSFQLPRDVALYVRSSLLESIPVVPRYLSGRP